VDDNILVRRCLFGDNKAFEEIVDKYQKKVFNAAFRILNHYEDAADVTQAVFIRIYENLDKFSARYKFFSWLYKITVNESLNFLKGRKESGNIPAEDIAAEKTPEDVYKDIELSENIQQALMKIGLDYRVVIVLHYFQDLSYNEISYVLELPERTVKSRLFTARTMLRDILRGENI
jgi:RNA polymerase sigma-70 factor (ECF subfamily)